MEEKDVPPSRSTKGLEEAIKVSLRAALCGSEQAAYCNSERSMEMRALT